MASARDASIRLAGLAPWSLLLRAERQIALLDACAPLNAHEERERVTDAWQRGQEAAPSWVLRERASLAQLRAELDAVSGAAVELPFGALYAARAAELSLEAALVETRGSRSFASLCRARYPVSADEQQDALAVSRRWLETQPRAGSPRAPRGSAASLAAALRRRISELGLTARVELRRDLLSTAAVAEGVVFVAEAAEFSTHQLDRIVLHEIEGHLVPRARGLAERWGLFRAGTAGSGEDEEGRALLLEERAGYLDPLGECGEARCRELALRHVAAHAVREGADFIELMRLLRARGEPARRAYRLSERALRGGGLAREICYLPALARLRDVLARRPELERWLVRGRVSVAAAAILEAAELERGSSPDVS